MELSEFAVLAVVAIRHSFLRSAKMTIPECGFAMISASA
jgi:hypothetical protein